MNSQLFDSVDKAIISMIRNATHENYEGTSNALKEAREHLLKAYILAPLLT